MARAVVPLPPGGLDIFVIDSIDSRDVVGSGLIEPGEDGFTYRLNYQEGETDRHWTRLTNLEHLDRAVGLLHNLLTEVRSPDGTTAAALVLRITANFKEGAPQIGLLVRYISERSGTEIVPIEQCHPFIGRRTDPLIVGEAPDWKYVRVEFRGTNGRGRRNKRMFSHGRVFLGIDRQPTELIPQVDLVYPGTTVGGEDINYKVKLNRHDIVEAFLLFNFGKPVLVEHPRSLSIVAAVPSEVVIDLETGEPQIRIALKTLGADAHEILIEPTALKGTADIFCGLQIAGY